VRRGRLLFWTAALALALAGGGAEARWGTDINAGTGAALAESVKADLLAIVKAAEADRARVASEFAQGKAADGIEAVKRFRNPELRPLFHALLDHADWHVVHRALLALERMEDGTVVPRAFALLAHEEPRLREKAAITCLRLWAKAGKSAPAGAAARVDELLVAEGDPHVRSCLETLAAHLQKKATVERVSDEVRVTTPEGLIWTPFLDGMDKAGTVAPGVTLKPVMRTGGGSAARLAVAKRWTTPLLGFRREEVEGTSLQPFANLRNEGRTYHTGLDVGACLDGAGLYACAEGVVRLVHTGSDMGTLIVLEHHVSEHEVATLLYMHASDVVFVKAGEVVPAGQLLGSMGVGYSFENGGHFAHLHFGTYPGPFSATHNYGYKPVSAGLRDWFDPVVVIPDWIDRTRPPVDDPGSLPPALRDLGRLLRDGSYAKALADLDAKIAGGALDEPARAAADRVRASLTDAGAAVVARAKAQREKGYPTAARAILARVGTSLAGVPGGDEPGKTLAAWDSDPAFKKDLAAEARFEKALVAEEGLVAKKDPVKLRALWQDLSKDLADTALAPRVAAKVAESGGK
jgi:hypothetical protein